MTSDRAEQPTISIAIIVDDGRILLVKRHIIEGSSYWQYPAGEVGPGESAEEAAVRVTLKETGLAVRATALLDEQVHPYTGEAVAYVACDVIGGEAHVVDETELAEVEWAVPGEFKKYLSRGFEPVVVTYLKSLGITAVI